MLFDMQLLLMKMGLIWDPALELFQIKHFLIPAQKGMDVEKTFLVEFLRGLAMLKYLK